MSDLLIGVGVLLAIIGPLLLIPIAWLLYRFAIRPLVGRIASPSLAPESVRGLALGITVGLIAAAMAASYFPGKQQFNGLCAQHGTPQIGLRVSVDGFYADQLFPYEAVAYIQDQGFAYVEAPDPYKEGVLLRYARNADGDIQPEVIDRPSSQYALRKGFSQPTGSLTLTEKVIYEIGSDSELARATSLNYSGGPLAPLFGAYAMASCPDPATAQGAQDFNAYYHLERLVLHSR